MLQAARVCVRHVCVACDERCDCTHCTVFCSQVRLVFNGLEFGLHRRTDSFTALALVKDVEVLDHSVHDTPFPSLLVRIACRMCERPTHVLPLSDAAPARRRCRPTRLVSAALPPPPTRRQRRLCARRRAGAHTYAHPHTRVHVCAALCADAARLQHRRFKCK